MVTDGHASHIAFDSHSTPNLRRFTFLLLFKVSDCMQFGCNKMVNGGMLGARLIWFDQQIRLLKCNICKKQERNCHNFTHIDMITNWMATNRCQFSWVVIFFSLHQFTYASSLCIHDAKDLWFFEVILGPTDWMTEKILFA